MGIVLAERVASVTLFSSPALCPQDCHVEENAEEERRATGFPTAQIQVKWGFCFFLKGCALP